MIGHDTGCITTLDKNQWIGKAVGKVVDAAGAGRLPVRRAGVRRASRTRSCSLHWHASSTETLMEKLGIDWQAKKAEFEAYLEEVKAGRPDRNPLRPAPHDHLGPGLQARSRSSTMSKPILIVGGGPAGPRGRACARERRPARAFWWRRSDRLGGAPILSGYAKLVPSGRVGQGRHRRHGRPGREQPAGRRCTSERTVKAFARRARRTSSAHALRRRRRRGRRRHPLHRLHALRLGQQARMGLRHLSRTW